MPILAELAMDAHLSQSQQQLEKVRKSISVLAVSKDGTEEKKGRELESESGEGRN